MYQTDWLLRQIEQMGDVLRRLIAALREHRPEDAIALTREAVRDLLDTDADLVDALTGEGLVTLLSAGGTLDTFRAHMLAELLVARADALSLQGRTVASARERQRARTLLEAVAPLVEGADERRVVELLGWLEG
ncbi:MAG: hypothetical protein JW733_04735 [Coriobacteriia bacterium]|nr:hypothetical protein [Coriobacteriia bacterium]